MITEKIQLEGDEVILLKVRKHWFILCVQVCSLFLLGIFPLFAGFALYEIAQFTVIVNTLNINSGLIVTLYTAWLILIWMILFTVWTNYYLDLWIITNKRFIAVDQNGFFHRSVASFRLERMQDIRVSVNGFIATFLEYGTLEIQTAGEEEHFKIFGLPSPSDIKSVILKSADALLHDKKEAIDAGL